MEETSQTDGKVCCNHVIDFADLSHFNIHCLDVFRGKALQESLIKLVEACGDESHNVDRWLSKLENSKWLSHVQTALSTAGLLAECVER